MDYTVSSKEKSASINLPSGLNGKIHICSLRIFSLQLWLKANAVRRQRISHLIQFMAAVQSWDFLKLFLVLYIWLDILLICILFRIYESNLRIRKLVTTPSAKAQYYVVNSLIEAPFFKSDFSLHYFCHAMKDELYKPLSVSVWILALSVFRHEMTASGALSQCLLPDTNRCLPSSDWLSQRNNHIPQWKFSMIKWMKCQIIFYVFYLQIHSLCGSSSHMTCYLKMACLKLKWSYP